MDQFPTTPEGRNEKACANRAMFDRIAPRYDLLNRVISLGIDQRWRRRLVALCEIAQGACCLDLCCGTGDVTRMLARQGAQVVGLDASENMLAIARAHGGDGISYAQGDALSLPYPDASFDAVTIAFGNRNVAGLDLLYREMRRVTKPGGRVVSLEINRPSSALFAGLFFLYFTHIPVLLARLFGAEATAYRYLPVSVRRYPSPEQVAEIMRASGLYAVEFERHLGGIFVLHRGIA